MSQFSIIGVIACLIQIVNDSIYSNYIGVFIDSVILCVLFTAYLLNENGKNTIAKIIFTGFMTTVLFIFAAITPREVGIYLFFFPILGLSFLIYSNEEIFLRNISIAYIVLLLVILEFTSYHPFGNINILEGIEDNTSYYVNMIVSIFVLIFSVYNLNKINQLIEIKRSAIANELSIKNNDLLKTNAELDHFVYSTSHDLKAPLSSISGLINIAKLEIKEEKPNEYFDLIEERVFKLNSFIKDIIDLSKNSRLEVKKENINLRETIENSIENNRYIENARSIKFNIEIDETINIYIDKSRFSIILNNLISNAIKYHKNDGERFINITLLKTESNINLIVRDNGIGIDDVNKEKVFDMFYRGHESSEGSGLGLYIVKEIVSKLSGKITLKSILNEGTEFIIKIPIE